MLAGYYSTDLLICSYQSCYNNSGNYGNNLEITAKAGWPDRPANGAERWKNDNEIKKKKKIQLVPRWMATVE